MHNFYLCYHDFSVNNAVKAAEQIRLIANVAGNPITVAVIPDCGEASETEVATFKAELEKLSAEGFELLLHGASHMAKEIFERNFYGREALKLTNDEAEFAGLDECDSFKLLQHAIVLWESLGLVLPRGFVPPAWFGNATLKMQILDKFDFYEDRFAVYKKNGSKIISPALSFAGLPKFLLKVAQTSASLALLAPFGTPRLVFHPVDFETIGEKRILNLTRYAVSKRTRRKYAD